MIVFIVQLNPIKRNIPIRQILLFSSESIYISPILEEFMYLLVCSKKIIFFSNIIGHFWKIALTKMTEI
jgi:hypothetical protein